MGKAVQQARVGRITVTSRTSPSWSPGYISATPNDSLSTSTLTMKPDTIYNKPNAWGFRSMSPWSRSWLQVSSPAYSYSTKPLPGVSTWFHQSSTSNVVLSWLSRLDTYGDQLGNLVKLKPSAITQLAVSNSAKTRVLNKVSQKKWDLGVFAGELRETIGLANSLAKDVGRTYRKLAPDPNSFTGGWRKLVKRYDRLLDDEKTLNQIGSHDLSLLDDFANRWMEYTFGIRPALNDLHDATSYLESNIGQPLIAFAKAGASKEERVRVSTSPANAGHTIDMDVVATWAEHYALLFQSQTDGVSQLTQLGLDNPYSVGWELLPYSWMIDYVLGVGDWLQSWTATSGLQLKSGCLSTVWRGHAEVVGVRLNNPSKVAWQQKAKPLLNFAGGQMTRSLLSTFPVPAFAPSLKQSVGGFQLANSLFALRNLITELPKR